MAVTNTDEQATDEAKEVTDEDLRKLKEDSAVETSEGADETQATDETEKESEETGEDDGKTDDQAEDEDTEEADETGSEEVSSEFVKEFSNIKGDTLEDYARNLEAAYKNSTAEALRLKKLADEAQSDEAAEDAGQSAIDTSDPVALYMKQKMDEEINAAFADFSKSFPQVQDQAEYTKFTNEVAVLSRTILNSQNRLAPPKELYSKAAVILGWEPETKVDSKDKLSVALKGAASSSKTISAASKPKTISKITDAQVAIAKQMGGWTEGKSDAEIRKELETVT